MTVEVGILNKQGVALATDSAVTIGNGRGYYNTANKLFALSKYQPVAIMLYSNAAFMECPLEIIIKEYRKKLKEDKFDTLKEYWDDFKDFLKKFVIEYKIEQKNILVDEIANFLDDVDIEIQRAIKAYTKKLEQENENITEVDITSEINDIINRTLVDINENFEKIENDDQFIDILDEIKEEIEDDIKDKIDLIIGIELSDEMTDLLLSFCYKVLTKKIVFPSHTGIVIAGYGDKEVYPSIVSGEVSGCYFNKLKIANERVDEINNSIRASIIPFAQDDVIKTFMNGIDVNYMERIQSVIENNTMLKELDVDGKCREELIKKIASECEEMSHTNHWGPMVTTVSSAPKEELSQMAETLVNLTSFRRKMNMDEYSQTVGGPVDVAVITKGDGLIWIKRKQYFSKDINHQFIHNYFK